MKFTVHSILYVIMILQIQAFRPLLRSTSLSIHHQLENVSRRYADTGSLSVEMEELSVGNRDKEENFMRLALRHAQHAFREKEVPIGAVIVDSNGIVLATARNQVETKHDVTAHAEIECLRKATKLRNNWRLPDCTLYSTLEPCPMCLGAIQASRIKRVVYAASDLRVGACGSWVDLVNSKHPYHTVEIKSGLLQEESSILLKRFFQMRRRESTATAAAAENADHQNNNRTSLDECIDRGYFMNAMINDNDNDV